MNGIARFSVGAGLNAERALLQRVCDGLFDCQLLLWRPTGQALVMPSSFERRPGFALASQRCAAQGWPILLRDTGGEPVPQSSAVLNIALACALPANDEPGNRIDIAYERLLEPLALWLAEHDLAAGVGAVPGAFCDGRFNLTLEGRKVAGTAQRWRRSRDGRPVVLAHAAVLIDDWRDAMVDVVNRFYHACANDQRCQAESHLALGERLADAWTAANALPERYRKVLGWQGLNIGAATGLCPSQNQIAGQRSPLL
ncbi:lipoate--protein ligase family protein [Stutzerimonas stutzeri]|uniref:lipoate--protein ligase family protein n=1 Tax=Stutzerimonas stutzeri TaxID=316 RepID=UPI001C2E83DC|nr:lipoate--protein ligase family protein [Stutzerimonas stutzeri]